MKGVYRVPWGLLLVGGVAGTIIGILWLSQGRYAAVPAAGRM